MGSKHNRHHKQKRKDPGDRKQTHHAEVPAEKGGGRSRRIELVVKCDSEGSRDAITTSLSTIHANGVDLAVVSSGVGDVNKNDLLMAATADRLIIGYEVEVNHDLAREVLSEGVEIRLYNVIYRLLDDLRSLCASYTQEAESERVLGRAKVIRLFKSSRKGIILGCEVLEGRIARGDRFRVIGAMGEIYNGKVGSLHIEKDAVDSAGKGRQVGLKIEGFQKAAVGDLVECVKFLPTRQTQWVPVPGITRVD